LSEDKKDKKDKKDLTEAPSAESKDTEWEDITDFSDDEWSAAVDNWDLEIPLVDGAEKAAAPSDTEKTAATPAETEAPAEAEAADGSGAQVPAEESEALSDLADGLDEMVSESESLGALLGGGGQETPAPPEQAKEQEAFEEEETRIAPPAEDLLEASEREGEQAKEHEAFEEEETRIAPPAEDLLEASEREGEDAETVPFDEDFYDAVVLKEPDDGGERLVPEGGDEEVAEMLEHMTASGPMLGERGVDSAPDAEQGEEKSGEEPDQEGAGERFELEAEPPSEAERKAGGVDDAVFEFEAEPPSEAEKQAGGAPAEVFEFEAEPPSEAEKQAGGAPAEVFAFEAAPAEESEGEKAAAAPAEESEGEKAAAAPAEESEGEKAAAAPAEESEGEKAAAAPAEESEGEKAAAGHDEAATPAAAPSSQSAPALAGSPTDAIDSLLGLDAVTTPAGGEPAQALEDLGLGSEGLAAVAKGPDAVIRVRPLLAEAPKKPVLTDLESADLEPEELSLEREVIAVTLPPIDVSQAPAEVRPLESEEAQRAADLVLQEAGRTLDEQQAGMLELAAGQILEWGASNVQDAWSHYADAHGVGFSPRASGWELLRSQMRVQDWGGALELSESMSARVSETSLEKTLLDGLRAELMLSTMGDPEGAGSQFQKMTRPQSGVVWGLLGRADGAVADSNTEELATILEELAGYVAFDVGGGDLLVVAGEMWRMLGQGERAMQCFEKAMQVDESEGSPLRRATYRASVRTLEGAGRWEQAVAHMERLAEICPAQLAADWCLRLAELKRGRLDNPQDALTWIEKALALRPEQEKLERIRLQLLEELGRFEELLTGLEQRLEKETNGGQRARLLVRAAEAVERGLGEPERARAYYARALEEDEDLVIAKLGLARTYDAVTDHAGEKARLDWLSAKETHSVVAAYYALCKARLIGRSADSADEEALAPLTAALDMMPLFRPALTEMMHGTLVSPNAETRKEIVSRAAAECREWSDKATLLLSSVRIAQREQRGEEAVALWEEIIEEAPDWQTASLNLKRELAQTDTAIDRFVEICAYQAESASAQRAAWLWSLCGDLMLEHGRTDTAVEHYQSARGMDATSVHAEMGLLRVGMQNEQWSNVVTALEEKTLGAELLPIDAALSQLRRASILENVLDDPLAAVEAYSAVIETAPDWSFARRGLWRCLLRDGQMDRAAEEFWAMMEGAEATTGDGAEAPHALLAAAMEWGEQPGRAAEVYGKIIKAGQGGVLENVTWFELQKENGSWPVLAEQALAELGQRSESADPTAKARAYEHLARIDRDGRGEEFSAMMSLSALLELEPTNSVALRELEIYLGEQQRWDDLVEVYDKLARLPDDMQRDARLVALAWLLEGLGQKDRAFAVWRQVLDVDPQRLVALRRLDVFAREKRDLELGGRCGEGLAAVFESDVMTWAVHATRAAEAWSEMAAQAADAMQVPGEKETETGKSEEEAAETEGEATETEGKAAETEGEATETEGKAAETEGEATETEGKAAETEGEATETEGKAAETEGEAIENEGKTPQANIGGAETEAALAKEAAAAAGKAKTAAEHDERVVALAEKSAAGFKRVLQAEPSHLPAALAWLRHDVRRRAWQRSAEAARALGTAVDDPALRADAYLLAGVIAAEKRDDAETATQCFRLCLDSRPHDYEAFRRLSELYRDTARWEELADTIRARLMVEKTATVRVELLWELAEVVRKHLGETEEAKVRLHELLRLKPDHVEALTAVADLHSADEEWEQAADALTKKSRLEREPEVLKKVFFRLGEIYREHLPDSQKAVASFSRVINTDQNHLPALNRLAEIHESLQEWKAALAVSGRILQVEKDAERRIAEYVRLARILEEGYKDMRRAREALRRACSENPHSLTAIGELTAFYKRRDDVSSLHVHLDGAAATMRERLEENPFDVDAYHALFKIFEWKGTPGQAALVAALLETLGLASDEEQQLAARQVPPPVSPAKLAPHEVDGPLFGREVPSGFREIFRLLGDVLVKIYKADLKAFGLGRSNRITSSSDVVRKTANEVSEALGVGRVDIYRCDKYPSAMQVEPGDPPVIILGSALIDSLDAEELYFVLVRCLKLVQTKLVIPASLPGNDLAVLVASVVRQYIPEHEVLDTDPKALADISHRVSRLIPRKIKEELMPYAYECSSSETDFRTVGRWVKHGGDRAGLLGGGSVRAALGALRKASGRVDIAPTAKAQLEALQGVKEVEDLVRFVPSDAYAEILQNV
jgi:tetratricopeptide (TPR) repeat protein